VYSATIANEEALHQCTFNACQTTGNTPRDLWKGTAVCAVSKHALFQVGDVLNIFCMWWFLSVMS